MRNVNTFFSEMPARADIGRSRFDIPFNHLFTCNAGSLIPFYWSEVLPGSTFSIDTACLVRTTSPLVAPIIGDLYADIYYFFCPNRILWSHWKNFMGESERAWTPVVEYTVPQIFSDKTHAASVGSVADYLGFPVNVYGPDDGSHGIEFPALPFRAYVKVFSEWFRSENLTDPPLDVVNDSDHAVLSNNTVYGGEPFKVAKFHDAFSSATPAPQKGPDVLLPLGNQAPISGNLGFTGLTSGASFALQGPSTPIGPSASGTPGIFNASSDLTSSASENLGLQLNTIYADLSEATGSSVNQLRTAFQVQKLLERDSMSGTRYTEILLGHFGVHSPDQRLQRPEYLGGARVPININQVVQTSATDATSPQGNTAAYSLTINKHGDFTKSFTEHGICIGVMCIRYKHSYSQGQPAMSARKTRYDYYWPEFANLGNQAIKNKFIYADGSSTDDEVFGYQEAWWEYRYMNDRQSALMRSGVSGSLDVWHLGDHYTQLPYLSDAWIREDPANLDRALTVTSAVTHQFIVDMHVQNRAVLPMPTYSIPGLIDHH